MIFQPFTILLLATGIVFILLVLILTCWNMRREQKLADAERQEPEFSSTTNSSTLGSGWHKRSKGYDSTLSSHQSLLTGHRIDPNIDAIIELTFPSEISAEEVIAKLPECSDIDGKLLMVEGFSTLTQSWEQITEGISFQQLRFAIQLCSRSGQLSEATLNKFNGIVYRVAESLDSDAQLIDVVSLLDVIDKLHRFCKMCDKILTITLRCTGNPWSVDTIKEVATTGGLVMGSSNEQQMQFQLNNEAGELLICLEFELQEQIKEIYLLLYVPHTQPQWQAFDRMIALANKLKLSLSAEVIDSNGQTLTEEQLQDIKNQVEQLYEIMKVEGIEPGSNSALRLFST